MYSTTTPNPLGTALGVVAAGSAFYLIFLLIGGMIGIYLCYRVIRAGVRDGVVDALKKGDSLGLLGRSSHIQGYPPAQNYGAPPAPASEYSGYR